MVISSDSKLVDLSLRDFCERLGVGGGAPAGGSLAACLVATGTALGSMAFRSAGGERPPPGGTTSSIFQAARAEELDELRDRALDLVDRDAAALGALLASPAGEERRTALHGALEAPFETMEVALAALRVTAAGAPDVDAALQPDSLSAAHALWAGLEDAYLIVRANAEALDEDGVAERPEVAERIRAAERISVADAMRKEAAKLLVEVRGAAEKARGKPGA